MFEDLKKIQHGRLDRPARSVRVLILFRQGIGLEGDLLVDRSKGRLRTLYNKCFTKTPVNGKVVKSQTVCI